MHKYYKKLCISVNFNNQCLIKEKKDCNAFGKAWSFPNRNINNFLFIKDLVYKIIDKLKLRRFIKILKYFGQTSDVFLKLVSINGIDFKNATFLELFLKIASFYLRHHFYCTVMLEISNGVVAQVSSFFH